MGRELNAIGNEVQTGKPNGYYPFDFFKYSAAGVRRSTAPREGYFSPDGGVTNLDGFNANADDDFGDWASSAGNDAFRAFSDSGVVNAVTPTDVVVMDVLGWDAAPGPALSSPCSVTAPAALPSPRRRRRAGDGAAPPRRDRDAISPGRIARLVATDHSGPSPFPPAGGARDGGADWHLV